MSLILFRALQRIVYSRLASVDKQGMLQSEKVLLFIALYGKVMSAENETKAYN